MKRDLVESQKLQTTSENLTRFQLISDALDSSEDGFAILRAIRLKDATVENFELLLMNQAGANLAEVPKAELIGKSLTEIVGAETSQGLDTLFQKALLTGRSVKEIGNCSDDLIGRRVAL